MRTVDGLREGPREPLWIRRPEVVHLVVYVVAALVFAGQIAVSSRRDLDPGTLAGVLVAGAGVALSWWWPWAGLVVTSAASFAGSTVGEDRISVWMLAVLVLFSFTLRGRRPLIGTALVALFLLAALITVGDYRGGAVAAVAALFSAIAGGAAGAALRLSRDHWLVSEERESAAIATREQEAERRVAEERLRIARDLHDVVGHQVAMLSVNLGVAEIGLPEHAISSRQALDTARMNARNVVSETQRILTLLRRGDSVSDDALRPTPSVSAIGSLIASFEDIGLEVTATIALPNDVGEPIVGVTVYRVIQEALTNAYRHGDGPVRVDAYEARSRIHVIVENRPGHALRGPDGGSGLGLIGMRERVESCGGILTVESSESSFRVSAELSPVGVRPA